MVALVVVLNTFAMAIEYQLTEEHGRRYGSVLALADLCCLAFFTMELVLRCIGFGVGFVFRSPHYYIDIVVVCSGLIFDVVLPVSTGTFLQTAGAGERENDGLLNLVRALRVLRGMRVLRLLTIFEDLWRVVQ
ncbi:unnamed protein product, partial [Amoebophrya sp. A25]|eukprot:GSA25T00020055001.1